MTVFLLIVVFTMLVFLLISLPGKKAGTEASTDTGCLPGVRDGTTGMSGHHSHPTGERRHLGDAAGRSGGDDGGVHSGH